MRAAWYGSFDFVRRFRPGMFRSAFRDARCLALVPALLACGVRATDGIGPGVLLIVPDGLRADHLSAYGYDRATSPELEALAQSGVRFESVFAAAPRLTPAHASLLTGCDPTVARHFSVPEFQGLKERRWFVPARVPRLAVEFLAAGYATAAFVDHEFLEPELGFGLGFQDYTLLDPGEAEDWEGSQSTRLFERFLQWLRALPADKPWFAYVHVNQLDRFWTDPLAADGFFQPRPELNQVPPVANTDSILFAIPRSRWRGGVRNLGQYEAAYDDEILRLDTVLGRVFASLRRMGRFDSTSIHVVGSFGMQLGEAGLILTAGRYSRADIGVPWIFRPRAGLEAARGRSVPGLVSSMDVMPTLLELEGLPVPSGLHGLSQAAVARERAAPVAERRFVFSSCGLQEGCAVIGARHQLEYLLPLATVDPWLRRSWSGTWTGPALQTRMVFYDRIETPYPRLDNEERSGQDVEFAPYRAAALEWLHDMNDARAFLQAPLGRSGLSSEAIERLRTKGLVGAQGTP